MKRIALLVTVLLAACASAPPPAVVTPLDGDELSIKATTIALYNVISGPAGRRDWDRFKELFVPGAQLMVMRDGAAAVMSPDDYIARAKPNFDQNGFFERPVANRIERYRDIAHVFSTYEARHKADDAAPFTRGINSFQLVRIGDQWKIVTILWQSEDAAHPIPPAYLPKP